jgi:FkbM family methyltransferase
LSTDRPVAADRYGALAPGRLDRAVIAVTSRMPDNWLGLRLAILFRRIVTMRLSARALDVVRWGLRMRLHPLDNGCEKNLLFTPQMYEPPERAALAGEIARAKGEGRPFVFIDIGANVGLFSLFVAAHAGADARILAVEPEPGNFVRLRFNLAANPALPIEPLALALGEDDGEVAVVLNSRDRGGTRTRAATPADEVRVPCRPLLRVLHDCRIDRIDALKIDVEGTEDRVLAPFFRDAPASLWPRLILIEDSHDGWAVDLFALFAAKGYRVQARSRQNVMLHKIGERGDPALAGQVMAG